MLYASDVDHTVSSALREDVEPPRTETWWALLKGAERLFAERGIEGVSLRQIVTASGQRNPAAVQYHFRDKEGLIRAIVGERAPALTRARAEMLEALAARGAEEDLRELVSAVITPLLDPTLASSYYVRFLARLTEDRELSRRVFLSLDEAVRGGARVNEALQHALRHLPARVRDARIAMTFNLLTDELAQRLTTSAADAPPREVFVDDLLDAAVGLLSAPVTRR